MAQLFLILAAAAMVFPFVWMLLTSLKSIGEINRIPPTMWPELPLWSNYVKAWTTPESGFGRYMINSAILSIGGTAGQLFICILAGYAFALLDFPYKKLFFMGVLATMMIPFEITLIPNFITIRHLPLLGGNDILGQGGRGLYNSYLGMMLPGMANAFSIFLLRQAFLQIPRDFWEAAQLDGCSRRTFLWKVAVPLSSATVITAALFGLLARWNALLWPLLITSSESMRPVQVGLLYYQFEEGHNYHFLMAASAIAMLPAVLLYFGAQRWFEEGIASTGIKG